MYQPTTQTIEPATSVSDLPRWTSSFTRWVLTELRRIAQEFGASKDSVVFKPLYKDPDRVYPCMVVYFDASAPSAASGEGTYRRNKANSAWVFVG